jgi:hypothetical protein
MNNYFCVLNRLWSGRNRAATVFQAQDINAGVCRKNLKLQFTNIENETWELTFALADEVRDEISAVLAKHFPPLDFEITD